ncbi:uncharacterized protein EV420DRAFT_1482014 [Desarmillaria tabescens]|uniref:Uncharacterized protein n=1 Tax=Armillaria tabescens TaxID=1929756 RepID=A0AA39K277_ARMTA|nr:uncharacterized protein EV420DRAFT_1482014 [Desarmillaria tabescens]KAK0453023.1 hypothetical protein EV420DRAFT_1482014 [Desarmillaria tabescens]
MAASAFSGEGLLFSTEAIAHRVENYRRDFLLRNIGDYLQAIFNENVEAWWDDFLQRYILCYPGSVLDERLYGTALYRWSMYSLKKQLEAWMDSHGNGLTTEEAYHYLDRHLYATLFIPQDSPDPVSDNKNANKSTQSTESTSVPSTDVGNGYWRGLVADGMDQERVSLLAKLEKEKEEACHMAIEAWARDVYVKSKRDRSM